MASESEIRIVELCPGRTMPGWVTPRDGICDDSGDGLRGHEGGFHLSAGWLIKWFPLIGRNAEAGELFEALCNLAGPTGLLLEEYLPAEKLSPGNTAQAYSHLAVIDAALALERGSPTPYWPARDPILRLILNTA